MWCLEYGKMDEHLSIKTLVDTSITLQYYYLVLAIYSTAPLILIIWNELHTKNIFFYVMRG